MRFAIFLLATLSATPVAAATYQASPAVQPAAAKVIARETMWRCGNAGCSATYDHGRASVVCAQLVKKVGRVTAFAVNGTAFDAVALQKCNARAR